MVPKALSLQYATKLCLIIAMPMYVIQLCLYPLVVGMNALGNFFLGLLGVDRNESKSHYHSAEELQLSLIHILSTLCRGAADGAGNWMSISFLWNGRPEWFWMRAVSYTHLFPEGGFI